MGFLNHPGVSSELNKALSVHAKQVACFPRRSSFIVTLVQWHLAVLHGLLRPILKAPSGVLFRLEDQACVLRDNGGLSVHDLEYYTRTWLPIPLQHHEILFCIRLGTELYY